MAIRLTTTKEARDHVKALIYSESGFGKTWLCKTAPNPVIISAENGLLTLKDVNIPVIEISSFEDLEDAYDFVTTDERAKDFETICLDSISDIAETVLSEEKEKAGKDPRAAYGAYADKLLPMIKKFRDIPDKHVYFTAKMKRITDEFSGITAYGPAMPGQQLGQALPYVFDFCLALRIGQDEEGNNFRYLQTQADIQYICKARGGRLDESEVPDLTHIFDKALNGEVIEESDKTVPTEEVEASAESSEEEGSKMEVEGSFEEDAVEPDEEVSNEEIIEDATLEDEEVEPDSEESMEDAVDQAAEEAMMSED